MKLYDLVAPALQNEIPYRDDTYSNVITKRR